MEFATINQTTYYLPEKVHCKLEDLTETLGSICSNYGASESLPALLPVSHLHFPSKGVVTARDILDRLDQFIRKDDVFDLPFANNLIISGASSSLPVLGEDVSDLFLSALHEIKCIFCLPFNFIPEGPYVLTPKGLRQAWKVHQDPYGAFVTGVVPDGFPDNYKATFATFVPVPSRLYYPPPSPSKPLSGLRIAVKDIFDLAGVQTSNCCRAFLKLYPPKDESAPEIQKLIDMGGIIVGKVKTVQFAAAESPVDWFDFQCPFNPRGDGYLKPSSSSSGSAVATAAYDWIDIAIGSDTFGSVNHPAFANGIFGIRPTWGIQDLRGAVKVSDRFDTAGFFARDVNLLEKVCKSWIPVTTGTYTASNPRKVYFFEDLMIPIEKGYEQALNMFFKEVELTLGTTISRLKLSDLWSASESAPSVKLSEFLKTELAHIQLYEGYRNNEAFRTAYRQKFHEDPFVDPLIAYKWKLGKTLTDEEYDTAVKTLETFRDWMNREVIAPHSDTLLILPIGNGLPSIRTQYFCSAEESAANTLGFGFNSYQIPPLAGLPAITIPIGEAPYKSAVTGNEAFLPLAVILVGSGGTDHALVQLVNKLTKSSPCLSEYVTTGKRCWPLAASSPSKPKL